ncbi:MAG: PfkB family carbohydrate kinase [Sporomusaceae bacterium]|nr:PfkB family carbohydrate kinase [Sporomusaceae bacterium]
MVIGDMVADVYLEGKISRISREAPVLVLEHGGETVVPGGAANAVHNAATLGGDVFAVGVVGDDAAGRELAAILAGKSVHTAGLLIDPTRPTITKTRVMAGGLATVRQQIVRIDRESKDSMSSVIEGRLLEYIGTHIEAMATVVISDYGSMTLSPAVRDLIITACRRRDIPCIVDSRYNILAFAGATVVKQNEAEVAAALGYKTLDAAGALEEAGKRMLAEMRAGAILLTRGPDGMSLFEAGGKVTHIPVSNVSEVFDVTGAGDTAVVTAALALAAGASYVEAARLANIAAGIVVKKPGTATTTTAELREAVGVYHENHR